MSQFFRQDMIPGTWGNFPSRPVDLALVQMKIGVEVTRNIDRALGMIREAASSGADIICLPELFSTPYFPQSEASAIDYREPFDGRVYRALSEVAKETGTVLVGGTFHQSAAPGKGFNTSLIFGTRGQLLGTYQKMHIPQDPGFHEQNYFELGTLGYQVYDTPWCKVAVGICYDQWFPEVARCFALQGAEILFYPSAIGYVDGIEPSEGAWHTAWERTHSGKALDNNVIIAAVNRVGHEGLTRFWGQSSVFDGFGRTVAKVGDSEVILQTTVDLAHSDFCREMWRFRASRRPETYSGITESDGE